MSQADQTPGSKHRRPSLPAPASPPTTYGRPVYGQRQKPAEGSIVVTVTLRQDAAAAVLDLVTRHGLSRSGPGTRSPSSRANSADFAVSVPTIQSNTPFGCTSPFSFQIKVLNEMDFSVVSRYNLSTR